MNPKFLDNGAPFCPLKFSLVVAVLMVCSTKGNSRRPASAQAQDQPDGLSHLTMPDQVPEHFVICELEPCGPGGIPGASPGNAAPQNLVLTQTLPQDFVGAAYADN